MSTVSEASKRNWLLYKLRGGKRPLLSQNEIEEIESGFSNKILGHIKESNSKIAKNIIQSQNQEKNRKKREELSKQNNRSCKPRKKNRKIKKKEKVKKLHTKKFDKIPRDNESWFRYTKRCGWWDEDTQWPTYAHYCMSRQFKTWKKSVLTRDKYKCKYKSCGDPAKVAHHLHYRKWGTELLSDGMSVCYNCHRRIHYVAIKEKEQSIKCSPSS